MKGKKAGKGASKKLNETEEERRLRIEMESLAAEEERRKKEEMMKATLKVRGAGCAGSNVGSNGSWRRRRSHV